MPKQKVEKDTILVIIKYAIITLLAIFVFLVAFLILLPKEPDIIKGVTYDLKYPKVGHYSQIPPDVFEKDFKLMKETGINTIRLYALPPEFILDLADKYGIKVIETIVFPGDWTDFTSPYQLQALKREAIRNINRDINRECIYAWSIWNDAPWTYGSGKGDVIKAYGKEVVSRFLRELYETVKKHDPLRPVTAANLMVDEDARQLGADFLDILGYNEYLGVSDWQHGDYDPKLAMKMVDELVAISKEYKKPVLITETGYSTYWTKEPQEDVIRDQIRKVGKRLMGVILFQWADDWSKAGDNLKQDENVEEYWGLLEGERKPKGGYFAAKQMFRNTLFRNFMLAISDYFRGSYFAAKKRALRSKWKEEIIADKEIDNLQNELNLKPFSSEVPLILSELSKKFFERKGFNQFVSFLTEYKSSCKNSDYIGLVDYYISLAGWKKLEYLVDKGMWELYYAEKTRLLDDILNRLKSTEDKTEGKEIYLKVLYLEWVIHNDILTGGEGVTLERLENAVKNYSESTKDATMLLTYSELLKRQGETHLSEKLLREYAADVGKYMKSDKAILLLKEKANIALKNGDVEQAKVLYDSYVSNIVRHYSAEDASFAVLELANIYKRRSLFDESIEMCNRLISEFPDSGLSDDAAYTIALALKDKKLYSKAVKAFHDFIVSYPESDFSKSAIKETLSIFTIYSKETGLNKTISFLTEILALYPDTDFSIMARFELASSLAVLGRLEEAVREYQYIIDNHPDSEYARYSKSNIERLRTAE